MSINITLVGQAITFMIFVWFTMKFVWPVIMAAMTEREQKIADGLAAAERGHHELERAGEQAQSILDKAKKEAHMILENANRRAQTIISDSEVEAKEKFNKIVDSAAGEIEQRRLALKDELKKEIANIAVLGAEKIIKKNIDGSAQNAIINDLVANL